MKPATLLLAASLAGNAVLLGLVVMSPRPSPPAAVVPAPVRAGPSAGADAAALREALNRGDAAALAAAGIPPDVGRQLALGKSLLTYSQRLRDLQARQAGGLWWKARAPGALAGAGREEWVQATRELSNALVAAVGEDVLGLGSRDGEQLSFLDPGKRTALRRVLQDYDEMMARFGAGGIQVASDREKIRLLLAERDRDIAALLTPAERAEFELRTSPTSVNLRQRLGDVIQSEEDFRTLYALQKAFDDKYPREALMGRMTPEVLQQRSAAERQLAEDMRAALGEEKYAAIRRAADPDLRAVDQLASRLGLPAETSVRMAEARESFAAESQRILADAALSPGDRRSRIQELGTRARADLTRLLGAEAAEAYAMRSPWVSMLQGGVAFSTTPKDSPAGALSLGGMSVFPVMSGGAGVRQTISVSAGGGPGMFPAVPAAPGFPVVNEVQVISVTSSGSGTPAATGAAPTTTTPPPR